MFYTFLYKIYLGLVSKKPPTGGVMIQGGTLVNPTIEDNVVVNGGLLDVEKLEGGNIKRNRAYLPSPKELSTIYKYIIDAIVILVILSIGYIFTIKK